MKILMITLRDGQNFSLAKIADAFLQEGHEITIYAPFYAENVLKFFDERIPKFPLEDLTEDIAAGCDIIFAAAAAVITLAEKNILSVHKPIITYNYQTGGTEAYGGDFCFVPSLPTTEREHDNYMDCPRIGIGEPKYDRMVPKHTDAKRFLFIDSGHYPFGTVAKRELARTILDICRSFPDYELWIKPRFLPGDELITHDSKLNLYEVIQEEAEGKVPENLVMLTEHRDLMELIEQCCTVICMFTSAFMGAFVAGKGLVVLDGLPSEDVYDIRLKHFNGTRSIMLGSGAVIDYKKAKELLPEGAKCSDEYFRYVLAEKEHTADKICEVTEWLVDTFYKKQTFPRDCQCDYKDYKDSIREDKEMTWDKVVSNRYKNVMLQNMLAISYNVNAKLDVTTLVKRIDDVRQNGYISGAVYKQLRGKINNYRNECLIENRNNLLADDIDSGLLLKAYYYYSKYDEIINFPRQDIGAFYFYRGMVADVQGDEELVLLNLEKYMSLSSERTYIKEISDIPERRIDAYYLLIMYWLKEGNKEKARYYLEKLKEPDEATRSKMIISASWKQLYDTYVHWAEISVNNYASMDKVFSGKPMLVYGAGAIGKKVVLRSLLKDRIVAIVDKYSLKQELYQIPVIKPDRINDFKEVSIILVSVIKDFEDIKNELLEIRSDLEIVLINDMF